MTQMGPPGNPYEFSHMVPYTTAANLIDPIWTTSMGHILYPTLLTKVCVTRY